MNVVVQHMITDDNASDHAYYGLVSSVCGLVLGIWFHPSVWLEVSVILLLPLLTGILIELIQRVQRAVVWEQFLQGQLVWLGLTGPAQNSFKESGLDILQTWWFLMTYYVRHKHIVKS